MRNQFNSTHGEGGWRVTRRSFLSGLTLTIASAPFSSMARAPKDAKSSFDEICKKVGWDAKGKDAFFFVHATDLHTTETPGYDRGALSIPKKFAGHCFVDDINALEGNAFTALTGDLISNTTVSPHCWPAAERKWLYYKKWITDRLIAPAHQIIGNNDCAAVPYLKIFPDRPLWWSFERQGILFVALHGYSLWKPENTNHAGILYDTKQLAWAREVIEKSSARTLVLFTHEPLKDADSHCARRQLEPILEKFKGEEIWDICGHNHVNSDRVIRIGKRTVRDVETMTPVGIGFTVGDGGYRVFFCREGRIVGSAIRWLTSAGEPIGFAPSPNWEKPPQMGLIENGFPAETLSFTLAGAGEFPLGECIRIENRISNYYISRPHPKTKIPGSLSWKIPTVVKGTKVGRVVFRSGNIEGHLSWSTDGKKWEETPISWVSGKGARELVLPKDLQAEQVWIRLTNESKYECKFFGYALLG